MGGLPPALFSTQDAIGAITAYLTREMQRSIVSTIVNRPGNLVLFGEVHSADVYKAYYLGELVRVVRLRKPVMTNFHASERWPNTPQTRKIISDLLRAQPNQFMNLIIQVPSALDLVPFVGLLAQAANFPDFPFGMVPIDVGSSGAALNDVPKHEDDRHQQLFDSFVNSAFLCPDVPAHTINSNSSRGHMLLGARHAARTSYRGHGGITTCARLIGAGWQVHSVRLILTPDPEKSEQQTLVLRRGSADHTPIDLLPILRSIAGGKSFYADITQSDSPFVEVRDGDAGSADIAFNKLFDAILLISPSGPPFPTQ
jgi:hypothetical protein